MSNKNHIIFSKWLGNELVDYSLKSINKIDEKSWYCDDHLKLLLNTHISSFTTNAHLVSDESDGKELMTSESFLTVVLPPLPSSSPVTLSPPYGMICKLTNLGNMQILLPINLNMIHWVMGKVEISLFGGEFQSTVSIVDSMSQVSKISEKQENIIQDMVMNIKASTLRNGTMDLMRIYNTKYICLAKQHDGFSCGAFTINHIKQLIESKGNIEDLIQLSRTQETQGLFTKWRLMLKEHVQEELKKLGIQRLSVEEHKPKDKSKDEEDEEDDDFEEIDASVFLSSNTNNIIKTKQSKLDAIKEIFLEMFFKNQHKKGRNKITVFERNFLNKVFDQELQVTDDNIKTLLRTTRVNYREERIKSTPTVIHDINQINRRYDNTIKKLVKSGLEKKKQAPETKPNITFHDKIIAPPDEIVSIILQKIENTKNVKRENIYKLLKEEYRNISRKHVSFVMDRIDI
ncbi:hypothetical protein BN7_6728 [Wickerhamomyces ciferrii]|uniref:Ubiquitin-like protease family profile domain-containing protein n=1 Tax=Wickerhamomyces ciferrii (strain ATCC 14091 / BCRC 22168 / CBS 111 / JCM 3599 / NBRC 0793 / NRRL Y-1031 F-60-10) TaxID=1206466 RepID=K0KYG2_WICCF|nr:uncharacterized protein BN7_6728 [Wickerhamomyces ciferrii]CCH47117.1 hypothetical protein BN7_6728 [Wickerhamomyces ciferrii]